MNNLYHWHDEQTVKHEMQEADRAMEQARLRKEAGLSDTNLLARRVKALRNLLKARGERVENHTSLEQEPYLRAEKTECQEKAWAMCRTTSKP